MNWTETIRMHDRLVLIKTAGANGIRKFTPTARTLVQETYMEAECNWQKLYELRTNPLNMNCNCKDILWKLNEFTRNCKNVSAITLHGNPMDLIETLRVSTNKFCSDGERNNIMSVSFKKEVHS